MAEIFTTLKEHLSLKDINEDNWVFKLFSKASVGLCLLGSGIVAATQYFGNPIYCDFNGNKVDSGLFNAHCWIHGTKAIGDQLVDGCVVSKNDPYVLESEDGSNGKDTIYYQWVVFMLAINALIFALPHQIWKILEGGLMKDFQFKEAKSYLIYSNDKQRQDIVATYVKYFRFLKGHHNHYFMKFVLCEILNLIAVWINFAITNCFLDGHFSSYGHDVVHYLTLNYSERSETPNPMCDAFPTKVSCTLKKFGSGSGGDDINGYCILSQNIINEKIYLVLWFWFVLLIVVSLLQLLMRLATVLIPGLRKTLISLHVGSSAHNESLRYFLEDCNLGDWFLLHQIGKNTNKYFYQEFISSLTKKSAEDRNDKESERIPLNSLNNV